MGVSKNVVIRELRPSGLAHKNIGFLSMAEADDFLGRFPAYTSRKIRNNAHILHGREDRYFVVTRKNNQLFKVDDEVRRFYKSHNWGSAECKYVGGKEPIKLSAKEKARRSKKHCKVKALLTVIDFKYGDFLNAENTPEFKKLRKIMND